MVYFPDISVEPDPSTPVDIETSSNAPIDIQVFDGLPGRDGTSGGGAAFVHNQPSPSATWVIPHTFNRYPAVDVYDATGAQVDTDVSVSDSLVSITFAFPVAGKAVLA